ncbi:hypothetical protein PCK1_002444 [Pneumocystis canis]|nr:hypothetical protein PCK1_002444 [Pneumocystis canis]
MVTKDHWCMEIENAVCSIVSCQKPLVSKMECVNCRKCGKLFCNIHTLYQIKLSKEARHDPIHGIWSRVCKYCYEKRKGYMDVDGPIIDLFSEFKYHRKKAVDKINLYANRLEKRLSKVMLVKLLISNSINEPITNSIFKPIISFRSHKKALEQTVVLWEDDLLVTHCSLCKYPFNYINRKHHCRLCGKVVCNNFATLCSSERCFEVKIYPSNTSFNIETVYKNSTKDSFFSNVSIRICKDCERIVFSRKEFHDYFLKPNEIVTLYNELSKIRCEIEKWLPDFKNHLNELSEKNSEDVSQKSINAIIQIRTKILIAFSQYDKISKDISQLETMSVTVKKLQMAIHLEVNRFLQKNMCSLQFLPDSLKKKNIDHMNIKIQNLSKLSEKKVEQELQILEEQRLQIENWIKEANQRRKYDEADILLDNFRMLSLEIEKIQAKRDEYKEVYNKCDET